MGSGTFWSGIRSEDFSSTFSDASNISELYFMSTVNLSTNRLSKAMCYFKSATIPSDCGECMVPPVVIKSY